MLNHKSVTLTFFPFFFLLAATAQKRVIEEHFAFSWLWSHKEGRELRTSHIRVTEEPRSVNYWGGGVEERGKMGPSPHLLNYVHILILGCLIGYLCMYLEMGKIFFFPAVEFIPCWENVYRLAPHPSLPGEWNPNSEVVIIYGWRDKWDRL